MTSFIRRRITLLVVTMALVGGACGSSGSTGDGSSNDGTPAVEAIDDDVGGDVGSDADAGGSDTASGDALGEGDAGTLVVTIDSETRTYLLAECTVSPGEIDAEAREGLGPLARIRLAEEAPDVNSINLMGDPLVRSVDETVETDVFEGGRASGTLEWDIGDAAQPVSGTFAVTCN